MRRNTIILGSVLFIVLFLIQWAYNYQDKDTIGILGGILVLMAALAHVIRAIRGDITLVLTSWIIWGVAGIAQFITYTGDRSAIWAIWGNMMYPIINVIICVIALMYMRYFQERRKITLFSRLRLKVYDKDTDNMTRWCNIICLIAGLLSIGLYVYNYYNPIVSASLANYIAVFADACALIPTVLFVVRSPMEERPLPWFLFCVGFIFTIIAVTTYSAETLVLPVYMVIGSSTVWGPQVYHRLKNNKSKWY